MSLKNNSSDDIKFRLFFTLPLVGFPAMSHTRRRVMDMDEWKEEELRFIAGGVVKISDLGD